MATQRKSPAKKTTTKKTATKKTTAKTAPASQKKTVAKPSAPQVDRQRPPAESRGKARSEKQASPEYQPKRAPLKAAGQDQIAKEKGRITARVALRDEHNRRVGDSSR